MTVGGELLHPAVTNEYRPDAGRCCQCLRRAAYVTSIGDVSVVPACPRHNLAVLAMALTRSTRVVPTYPPYKENNG